MALHINPDGTEVPVPDDTVIGEGTLIEYLDGEHNYTIGRNVSIGANCTIGRTVHFCDGVTIGDGSIVEGGTFIGADGTVGSQCYIEGYVSLAPGAIVGNNVKLAGSFRFGDACVVIDGTEICMSYGNPSEVMKFPAGSTINVRMSEEYDT